MKRKPCAYTTATHHSKDRVSVYAGSTEPVTLCGYHASAGWIKTALAAVKVGK